MLVIAGLGTRRHQLVRVGMASPVGEHLDLPDLEAYSASVDSHRDDVDDEQRLGKVAGDVKGLEPTAADSWTLRVRGGGAWPKALYGWLGRRALTTVGVVVGWPGLWHRRWFGRHDGWRRVLVRGGG